MAEAVSGTEQGEEIAAALGASLVHAAELCYQPANAGRRVGPTRPGRPATKPPGEGCCRDS